MDKESGFLIISLLLSKSRITNAKATVAQLLSKAVRQEGAVILPALTFLLLFVSRQKYKDKIKL
ncbi:MAG: hypothetical protein IPF72_17265 [Chitinophagaceae bacterium]|nr:hypothetical protein [Chitinophagaceae bacterium]